MAVIVTKGLTKFYGKDRGIIDISLSVESGEIFGFIGPNGAGKSTTIRSLLGLIFPTAGAAQVFGLDVVRDTKAIKRRVGYLPSEVDYYDKMNTQELLDYSARFFGVDAGQTIRDLADLFDVDLKRPITDLSSGNKKKVSILQCFLHKPELLILDEPTNGLDPLMQNRFYQLVRQEQKRGATVFFSSHILTEVERICQRVAVVKEGRIIALEDVAGLRKKHLRRVNVSFTQPVTESQLNVSGITGWIAKNGGITFLYAGEPNDLLKAMAKQDVASISIEEPSLEEVFMHYYQEEEVHNER